MEPDTTTAIAVRQAVADLPPRQRQAILCRFYGQLSVAETAASMRCAEGTVKALTHQAIANLRGAGLHVADNEEVEADA